MLNQEWLQAFLPIGTLKGNRWTAIGAGFLFLDEPIVWLVTAKHVIRTAGESAVGVLIGRRNGGVELVNVTDFHQAHDLWWHEHEGADVAIGLMPQNPDWSMKAVGRDLCLPIDEALPSLVCYTVGCPYGLRGLDPTRATPLVLDGIIAGTNSTRREIYATTPTFPGNSGGPLLVLKTPFNPSGGLVVGQQIMHVGGVMIQTSLLPDPEDSGIPPLHLGVALSMEVVLELLDGQAVQAARRGIMEKMSKGGAP